MAQRHDKFINALIKLKTIYPEYAGILEKLIRELKQKKIDMEQERRDW